MTTEVVSCESRGMAVSRAQARFEIRDVLAMCVRPAPRTSGSGAAGFVKETYGETIAIPADLVISAFQLPARMAVIAPTASEVPASWVPSDLST